MSSHTIKILLTAHLVHVIYPFKHVPTYLFLTRVGPCHTGEATEIVVNEMTIARDRNQFSVSGTLNVTRDIPDGWMVRAIMQKCQDMRNLDTCDHFKSFTALENACTEEEASEDTYLYHSVFNVSEPRLSCPLKAGAYRISKYPFVTSDKYKMVSESKISTSMFGYTFRLEGYSDADMILCIEAYLQLVYSNNLLGNDDKKNESAADDSSEDRDTEPDDDTKADANDGTGDNADNDDDDNDEEKGE